MKDEKLFLPDEAIDFIVSNYARSRANDEVPIAVGIPSKTVEDVLGLFIVWATNKGLIEEKILKVDLSEE